MVVVWASVTIHVALNKQLSIAASDNSLSEGVVQLGGNHHLPTLALINLTNLFAKFMAFVVGVLYFLKHF